MTKLSVLLCSRADLFDVPGGDTLHIKKIQEGLLARGVKADIAAELKPDLSPYNIVHAFNFSPRIHDTYAHVLHAHQNGKPVALTPIYHNPEHIEEYDRAHRFGLLKLLSFLMPTLGSREIAKNIYRAFKDPRQKKTVWEQIKTGYRNQQKRVLKIAGCLVVQSEKEAKQIVKDFGVIKPYEISPIGVDIEVKAENFKLPKKLIGLKDYILCAGRIETRKNQLSIVNALKDIKIPLVLAGQVNPHHKKYFEKIQNEAQKNPRIIYIPYIEHKYIGEVFKRARVHVNASWYESTPHSLATLEAAAHGCNVVDTKKGYADDRYKDFFEYCDPASERSIRTAVLKAFHKLRSPAIAKRIGQENRWDNAIPPIIEAYRTLTAAPKNPTLPLSWQA